MNNHQQTPHSRDTMQLVRQNLAKRNAREKRFRFYGFGAVVLGLLFLCLLFVSIIGKGYTAFQQTYLELDVYFDAKYLAPDGKTDAATLEKADYGGLAKAALRAMFPDVRKRGDIRRLYKLMGSGAAFQLRAKIIAHPELIGTQAKVWVVADDETDMLMKGHIDRNQAESDRRLKDKEIAWIDQLLAQGKLEKRFNTVFFLSGDSRNPELSGILGAAVGSLLTLLITLVLSFPVGVASAVYLEEFAPHNRATDLIEVNINNLAAVPSIVFGLLGLTVFISFFGVPRSSALVGGLVLTLMTLPTIIIAARASLKSVPPSIREAALGVGASKMQAVFHHVLPLAMPGILTGTIIGMARALGETAPLLMIGMVAFIVDIPGGLSDPSTALPVQIYLWADSPERAFVERTSAAIMVLLAFLISMNALAVILRQRFERRW